MKFNSIPAAPPDAILGLTEAFKKDENPRKVNLGVGVYQNEKGVTATLEAVKRAEALILEQAPSKSYMPISGHPDYADAVQGLLFGADCAAVREARIQTAHTPGGTGGLRVGADFLAGQLPGAKVWMSNPTWANHKAVFAAAGLEAEDYPYYDPATRGLDFDGMMETLASVPASDVVLFHVCCHNPTGVDPSPEQWKQIAGAAAKGGWTPFLDFAYQGFGEGLEEDRAAVQCFLDAGVEFLVASSFSKNFGLYCDRTGALTLVAADPEGASNAFSQVKTKIRSNYSNPPAHGGRIVSTILAHPDLTALWHKELAGMRNRIQSVRAELVAGLESRGIEQDFSYIQAQKGMFSFSGLTDFQVSALRDQYGIYIVKGGRINVAGITPVNIDYLCDSVAAVLAVSA